MTAAAQTKDPLAVEEARCVTAALAMLDARDLANRAVTHALELRNLRSPDADAAAAVFDAAAAKFRALERQYAAAAGVSAD